MISPAVTEYVTGTVGAGLEVVPDVDFHALVDANGREGMEVDGGAGTPLHVERRQCILGGFVDGFYHLQVVGTLFDVYAEAGWCEWRLLQLGSAVASELRAGLVLIASVNVGLV